MSLPNRAGKKLDDVVSDMKKTIAGNIFYLQTHYR